MSRSLPPRLRPAGTRALRGVLFALLAIALATPALAMASHKSPKKPASVPNCEHFSLSRMDELSGSGALEFEGKTPGTNSCTYKGEHIPNDYSDVLQVSVVATSRAVFEKAKNKVHVYAPKGSLFHNTKIRGAVAAFYVINTIVGEGECRSPGAPVPELGPPTCSGLPEWTTVSVYAYGRLKPKGPNASVFVGVAGAYGRVFSSGAISVIKEILSGQIR